MTEQVWENVLTLLAIVVLADHRVRDPEMVEFCHEAGLINHETSPERIMTAGQLRRWFNANRDRIDAALIKDIEGFTAETLKAVTDPELRRLILQAMFAISICDYELHDEENEILKTAISTWQLTFDPQTIMATRT